MGDSDLRALVLDAGRRSNIERARLIDLLQRFKRELPSTDFKEVEAGRSVWPSCTDSTVWLLAGLQSRQPTVAVEHFEKANESRGVVREIALAAHLLDPASPTWRKTTLADGLKQTARALALVRPPDAGRTASDSSERRRIRITRLDENAQAPSVPKYAWLEDRVDHRGFSKVTRDFTWCVEERHEVYRIPWLHEAERLEPGYYGSLAFQLLGQPFPYQRVPWNLLVPDDSEGDAIPPEADEPVQTERSVERWVSPGLQNLRVEVLRRLASAAERDRPIQWGWFRDRIAAAFVDDSPEDRLQEGEVRIRAESPGRRVLVSELVLRAGPLVGLLELVGHVECELEAAPYHEAARALESIRGKTENPFDVLGTPDAASLDRGIKRYLDREDLTKTHWGKFRARLLSDLAAEFYARPDVEPPKVRRRYREAFERKATEALAAIQGELEATREETEIRDDGSSEDNVFALDGSEWFLRFEGRETRLPADLVGWYYIRYILQRGAEGCSASEVRRNAKGSVVAPWSTSTLPEDHGMSERDIDQDRRYGLGTVGISAADIERYRKLEEELASASGPRRSELKRQMKALERRIGGDDPSTSRRPSRSADKDRVAVRAAIKIVLGALRTQLPHLADHFGDRNVLRVGMVCRYCPPPPVPIWSFDPP